MSPISRAKRGLEKANSRTVRTAVQMTPAGVIAGLLEAFVTTMTPKQVLAIFGLVQLLTVYVQNYLEGRANRHLFEDPVGPAYEPELKP